ncbi:glycoside hydrolase family 53 protein [Microbacterium radiodurans]|uniref:Arabinogalactan endo-beta-1,4-galactanase n=1 Tax=Microbacterium radiodurans TaxID=661398 RepID=A0A5J5IT57_9MICO|nr:glycosyl hydrolase 53 family protein [Microbacterium radiodurans]KAA9087211.1 arabinogalactan endo-1,4-beta-galactosidase [Microbacterium radiodurans]
MTQRPRRRATALAAAAAAALIVGGLPATAATAAFDPDDFVMGGDLGMIHEVESLGGQFSRGGAAGDPIEIMADSGMNLARLRLWVDPYTVSGEPYGGGTNDLATTIATAQRAQAAGMDILLDFHLSDWWADPGTQTVPKAWRTLSYPQLVTTVHDYTNNVIDQMRAAGVLPDLVQMGNEIPAGILWDHGRVGNGVSDFSQLADLLSAGIDGVDAALAPGEDIEIVLHLDHGGDNALYRWWFDEITAHGVPFDIIGLSYYPFWHGTMGELAVNLNDISARYGKDVLIVETAYGWTLGDGDGLGNSFYLAEEAAGGYPATVAGQTAFLRDLRDIVRSVPNGRGRGLIWWEPGWLPVPGANWGSEAGKLDNDDGGVLSNPWDNQTLFDWSGEALATLDVFDEVPPADLAVNGGFEQDGYTNTPTGWGVWSPGGAHANAVFTQDPAVVGEFKLTFWKSTPYTASIYQTFTGLSAGTYRISAWTLNGGGQNAAYLYAKNAGGSEQQASLPVSSSDWRRVAIEVPVTSGSLTIGFLTDAQAGGWMNVDDVRVERVG